MPTAAVSAVCLDPCAGQTITAPQPSEAAGDVSAVSAPMDAVPFGEANAMEPCDVDMVPVVTASLTLPTVNSSKTVPVVAAAEPCEMISDIPASMTPPVSDSMDMVPVIAAAPTPATEPSVMVSTVAAPGTAAADPSLAPAIAAPVSYSPGRVQQMSAAAMSHSLTDIHALAQYLTAVPQTSNSTLMWPGAPPMPATLAFASMLAYAHLQPRYPAQSTPLVLVGGPTRGLHYRDDTTGTEAEEPQLRASSAMAAGEQVKPLSAEMPPVLID